MNTTSKITMGATVLVMFLAGIAPGQTAPASAAGQMRLKMTVIEGVRSGAPEPPKAVTSSSLTYGLTVNLKTEIGLAEVLKQISRTFNFASARMLTEADFQWTAARPEKDFQVFRLDGKEYAVFVTPTDPSRRPSFRLEVFEQNEKGKTNLLDTEFTVPSDNATVFGFEDTKGTSYFLAFQPIGWQAGEAGTAGEPVRAVGEIKPPRLVKFVDPVYPDVARQAGVQGVVILEATTDKTGVVVDTKILRSIPLLDQAAIDAVRQWRYEPMIIKGQPHAVVFTVTVRFSADEKKTGVARGVAGGVTGGVEPMKITAAGAVPKLITMVDPVYPEKARQARVQGVVILEATIDVYGRVQAIKVLRSIPLLDQAAIDAVKQWVYEPVVVNGKSVSASFTLTVRFQLDGKGKEAVALGIAGGVKGGVAGGVSGGVRGGIKEATVSGFPVSTLAAAGVLDDERSKPIRATGDIQPPKVLTQVDPVYPEEARQAGVSGVVILEAETDTEGRVVRTKVLRSIPALDQAAIEAVKQWTYAPMIIDGKPRGCVFTVTCRFALK
jgi:TonB family protein